MADAAPSPMPDKTRRRPTHWDHPVDEDRRAARARRHRRRRVLFLLFCLVVVALVAAYSYLTSDKRIERFSEQYLENLLGTRVTLGAATFSWDEGLVLTRIGVASPEPFTEPFLSAERVYLKVAPLSLVRLAPEVTEIVVRRPRITLVQGEDQVWNLQLLARRRAPELVAPRVRPVVALEEGILRIVRRSPSDAPLARQPYVQEMKISGLLLPSQTDPRLLRFQTHVATQQVHLAVATGEVNVRTGAVRLEGQASNVVLSEALRESLPAEAQRIWAQFSPSGSVNVKVLFDEQNGLRLLAELTGVHLLYRYGVGERNVYQFENLTGKCVFSPSRLVLTQVQGLMKRRAAGPENFALLVPLASHTGAVRLLEPGDPARWWAAAEADVGVPLRINGQVGGFDADRLSLDLAVQAEHVDFERSRDLLVGLAPHLESIYQTFSPRGPADLDLTVRRGPGPDDSLEVEGVVFCRGVEMTYRLFPYRLEGVHGRLGISRKEYKTLDETGLVGRHGQAQVTLTGWARNPGPTVESQVIVRGRTVPLDEDLRTALSASQRETFDQYAPSGTADLNVTVYRPPVKGARPEVSVEVHLLDCRLKYAGFPYLLEHACGQVNIKPGRTEIVGVEGRHGKATVALSGESVSEGTGPATLNLKVTGKDVPLDDDLAAALPQRERAALAVFHLSGLADIEGTVTQGPQTGGRLDYNLDIRLRGARMIYEPFPFEAEEVTGTLHLSRAACRVDSLTGYNSGARIEARGWIEQRPEDYAMDLVLTGSDVPLGESLRGALTPEIRAVWSRLQPKGRVNLNAHLTKAFGPQEKIRHHVWVDLLDAQAVFDVFPYPLEHAKGKMEFQGSEVLLHDVRARSGLTEFALAGRIAYDQPGPAIDLALQTRGLRLEGPLRDAVPEPVKRAFAILNPTGRVDLNLEQLSVRYVAPGKVRATWLGSAVLDEVGLEAGIRMSGLVGTAEVAGKSDDGRVAIDGRVRIQQGKVADKDVANTTFAIDKADNSPVVSLRNVEGEFYGGRMEGFAALNLTPGGKYAVNLAATDVDFEKFLRDGFRLEHNITGGRLKATLGLWARGPDTATLEASGYAHVSEAQLYKLPPVVRLLNVLRLAPPDQTAFQSARVLYFIRGKRLILGDIRLEGRAMNLYGAGTMEADGRLDLAFVTGKKDDDPLIPALTELMEGVRKQVVVVVVTGTLGSPVVEPRTLSAVTNPIRELLGLVREQRQRERQQAAGGAIRPASAP